MRIIHQRSRIIICIESTTKIVVLTRGGLPKTNTQRPQQNMSSATKAPFIAITDGQFNRLTQAQGESLSKLQHDPTSVAVQRNLLFSAWLCIALCCCKGQQKYSGEYNMVTYTNVRPGVSEVRFILDHACYNGWKWNCFECLLTDSPQSLVCQRSGLFWHMCLLCSDGIAATPVAA